MHYSHYRVEEEIGRGGMGVVYRAVDTRLGRPVAIKVLPAGSTGDGERNRRFVGEARSASALNHPAIVTIHEIDEHDGTTFIAMELIDGTPLDRLLARGPLPLDTALDYARQIASGLAAAHAAGLVHRDIKPANIMITRDGRAKILDFGLAKLVEAGPGDPTITGTRAGTVLGTAAYMSPEQAQGQVVTARSDVFSFGAVFYEMLAGRRAFAGDSDIGLLTAILRDTPPPVAAPAEVQAILDRCLAKDPAARYANGHEVHAALAAVRTEAARRAGSAWRRPALVVPLALVLVAAAALGIWQVVQARREARARNEMIPEIERLVEANLPVRAIRLARDAEAIVPQDVARLRGSWYRFNLASEPSDADVSIRNYVDAGGVWEPIGRTPIKDYLLPAGYYRVRVVKPGYMTLETAALHLGRGTVTLAPEAGAPPGMVLVSPMMSPGGTPRGPRVAFWLDRYEVVNKDFKRFVDAGGYRDPKYWKAPFRDGARVLPFDEAMTRFRDTTGVPGPATWELETFPAGQDDFPVGGISWFEAAAYAEFMGKSLPTARQWIAAASLTELYGDVIRVSNFDGKGPVKAGEREGLSPYGTFDMAGNVKEWVLNTDSTTARHYILGGGWNEPAYRFSESDAQDPWQRAATFGVRLARNLEPLTADETGPIPRLSGDPKSVVPVSAAELEIYKRFYTYDRTPLQEKTEAVDDSSPDWRKEKVSFAAAYGGERVPVYLFLPRKARPPYQTVVVFPSGYARITPSSAYLDLQQFDFIMRSGRAALYPIYQGTYERRPRESTGGTLELRDTIVQQMKDLGRAVDYLATRPEIDVRKLGYYSVSMGAYLAPMALALEPRIKTAVVVSGGVRYGWPPEIHPSNFAPQVKVPVILINGRDDFGAPAADRERFIELLGTPAAHKRLEVLEGGHFPHDMRSIVRLSLEWYDKYLGPVAR